MSEANLQTLWPSYSLMNKCTVFIVMRTIPGKTAIHLPSYAWCNLRRSQSLTRYRYTICGKVSCTVTLAAKDTWYCLHQLEFNMVCTQF